MNSKINLVNHKHEQTIEFAFNVIESESSSRKKSKITASQKLHMCQVDTVNRMCVCGQQNVELFFC